MKTNRYAQLLLSLLVSIFFGNAAVADPETSGTKEVLLGTTWVVQQCLAFDSQNVCNDPKHPMDGDLIKVSVPFNNVEIVTFAGLGDNDIYNFKAEIVGSGFKSIDIDGTAHQVEYLQAEFVDTGGGGHAVDKRLDLHVIHNGSRSPNLCRKLLMNLSKDKLSPDTSGGARIEECIRNKPRDWYHVHWSICTLDRQKNTCVRKEPPSRPTMAIPPDDSQGTGSGGDTGFGLREDGNARD